MVVVENWVDSFDENKELADGVVLFRTKKSFVADESDDEVRVEAENMLFFCEAW